MYGEAVQDCPSSYTRLSSLYTLQRHPRSSKGGGGGRREHESAFSPLACATATGRLRSVLFPETMVFGVRLAESIVLCAAPPAMGTTWVGSVSNGLLLFWLE